MPSSSWLARNELKGINEVFFLYCFVWATPSCLLLVHYGVRSYVFMICVSIVAFLSLYILICLLCLVLFVACLFKRIRKRAWSWMDGDVGRKEEEMREWKSSSDILYKKKWVHLEIHPMQTYIS